MPTISTFFRIVITMNWRDHEPPHFDARLRRALDQPYRPLKMIRLPFPEHYLITPEPATYPSANFLTDLSLTLSSGVRLVQLRSKLLTAPAFARLADQVVALCHQANARVILNGPMQAWHRIAEQSRPISSEAIPSIQAEIDWIGADGVHLSSDRLMRCVQRPLRPDQWVSAACHTLLELQQAAALQLDFVTLSPVLLTATHTDAEPLGWHRFASMARAVNISVFALGGMSVTDVTIAQVNGAHGIAAIRSLWRCTMPEA